MSAESNATDATQPVYSVRTTLVSTAGASATRALTDFTRLASYSLVHPLFALS